MTTGANAKPGLVTVDRLSPSDFNIVNSAACETIYYWHQNRARRFLKRHGPVS